MSQSRNILAILMTICLFGCQGGEIPVSSESNPSIPQGFPALSRCTLTELVIERNGVRSPDPEFERINKAMEWHFVGVKNLLRSRRQAPGRDSIVFEVPIVKVSRETIIAEGPTPIEFGRMHKRVEISRQPDPKGQHLVVQSRTWTTPDRPVGTLLPFHKSNSTKVTWTLACEVSKTV